LLAAAAQLGRDRQAELAPGRLDPNLGRPQQDLLRPGGQAEAAAAAGFRLEPGELEAAVDESRVQLQALGFDAGDPPAQEITEAVTDP
jgi:hypothetical protein